MLRQKQEKKSLRYEQIKLYIQAQPTHIRLNVNMLPISQTRSHLERCARRILRRRRRRRDNRRINLPLLLLLSRLGASSLTSRPLMHFLLLIRLGEKARRRHLRLSDIRQWHFAALKQLLLLNVTLDITIQLPELFCAEPAML